MFNQYIWGLYLKSGGSEVVSKFEFNLTHCITLEYSDFIKGLRQNYTIYEWIIEYDYKQLTQQYEDYKEVAFPDKTLTFSGEKDIDGFCENAYVYPATPVGIMSYLKGCSYQFEGKNAVVIGRSDIVGKPMAKMLLDANCTVTICHSKTKNLKQYTRLADLVVVATGHRNTIVPGMTKKNAIIIDVGINFDEEGKMCGDVSKELVQDKDYEFLSPVPGGVGLLTRLAVIINTLSLFLLK